MSPASSLRTSLLRGALRVFVLLVTAGSLVGCNAGAIAIALLFALDDDDGSGSTSGPAGGIEVEILDVENQRTRPAQAVIVISLKSSRSTTTDVLVEIGPSAAELRPAAVGGGSGSGGSVSGLAASPAGSIHRIPWNALSDNGGSDDLEAVLLRVSTGTTKDDLETFIGNDAPEFVSVTTRALPRGDIEFTVGLRDSSSDPAELDLRYTTSLDENGALVAATIEGASTGLTTSPVGVTHLFVWKSGVDLGFADRTVQVLLTPRDRIRGIEGKSGEPDARVLELDNNTAPSVSFGADAYVVDGDGGGRQRIEFVVTDAEGDPVDVIVQWSTEAATFPALAATLDGDPAARAQTLSNPELRRDLQIISTAEELIAGSVEAAATSAALAADEILASSLLVSEELRALAGITAIRGNGIEATASIIGTTIRLTRADGSSEGRKVCEFDVDRGVLVLDAAFAPSAAPGDRFDIVLANLDELSSSTNGLRHRRIWDSARDVPGGGEVFLRFTPFDRARALLTVACSSGTTFPLENAVVGARGSSLRMAEPKSLNGPFGASAPRVIELAPVEVPAAATVADVDADGRADVVVVNRGLRSVVVLHQAADGFFDLVRFLDARLGDPRDATVTDLDGDGDSDIAVVGDNPGSIALFLQGAGLDLVSERIFLADDAILVDPSSIAAGDIDGDGDTDLVVADAAASTPAVLVLLREGGAASPCAKQLGSYRVCELLAGTTGNDVGVADIDEDGRIDIAVARPSGVTIFYQGAAADFDDRVVEIVVPNATLRSLAIGDMTGDGRKDLAVSDSDSGSVFRLRQVQPDDFAVETAIAARQVLLPVDLALIDLDGVGGLDILVADAGGIAGSEGSALSVSLSDGRGAFSTQNLRRTSESGTQSVPRAVAVGDLDGDGSMDIISLEDGTHAVAIYPQDGAGSFARAVIVAAQAPDVERPKTIVAADFDGDGNVDLLTQSGERGDLTILERAAPAAFAARRLTLPAGAGPSTPLAIAAGDIDGDSRPDIVVTDVDRDEILILFQESSGAFGVRSSTLSSDDLDGMESVALGDIDGDGRIDIVAAGRVSNQVVSFRQETSGAFAAGQRLETGATSLAGPVDVELIDLDLDGRLDVCVAGHQSANLVVWFQGDGGGFTTPVGIPLAETAAPLEIAIADIDDDGDRDIVAVVLGAAPLVVARLGEARVFSTATINGALAGINATSLALGDLNGDGRVDVVIADADETDPSIWSLLGTGAGGFASATPRLLRDASLGSPRGVVVADIDGDGELDVTVASRDSNAVTVFPGGR
jgi:hypothetical protein